MDELKLLIFDWDGTLCDSISRIVECMQSAAVKCGVAPCGADAVKAIIGLSLDEAIRVLHGEHRSDKFVELFRMAYGEAFISVDQCPSGLFAKVRSCLEGYANAGYYLAVATGKSRGGLDRALAQHDLSGFFDVTRCADETRGKPDPLMLHEILAHCAVPAKSAVMVGDSVFDLEMARRAQMQSIAVTYGAQSRDVLVKAKPDAVIDHFFELTPWVSQRRQSAGVCAYVG
jgi:phosphoglycolate phosphatase